MLRIETNQRGDVVFYQSVPSKAGVYFISGFAGFFGLMCLVAGLSNFGVEGAGMVLFSLVPLAFAWRFARFTLGPYLSITSNAIVADKFIRLRRWKFTDITALASFETEVQPQKLNAKMPKMPKVPVHFLGIRTRDGRTSELTLPDFRGNRRLLQLVEERTRLKIETIPDDEAAWKDWQQAKV